MNSLPKVHETDEVLVSGRTMKEGRVYVGVNRTVRKGDPLIGCEWCLFEQRAPLTRLEKPEDSYTLTWTLLLTVTLLAFSLICLIYNAATSNDIIRDIQDLNRRMRAVEQRQ